MPRTKFPKKRRQTQDSTGCNETCNISQEKKKDLKQKIIELDGYIGEMEAQMRIEKSKALMEINLNYKTLLNAFKNTGMLDMTLNHIMNAVPEREDKENFGNEIKSVNKSQRSVRKRSQSVSSRSVTKKTQHKRSSSYDNSSKFKTPVNRNIPSMPVVTPKVNPNSALTVLRRPKQGEFAMSAAGSPLMVSSVTNDDVVSISIPMPDGRVFSILPTEGIDGADLNLDPTTKAQLLKLRHNLTKCLQK